MKISFHKDFELSISELKEKIEICKITNSHLYEILSKCKNCLDIVNKINDNNIPVILILDIELNRTKCLKHGDYLCDFFSNFKDYERLEKTIKYKSETKNSLKYTHGPVSSLIATKDDFKKEIVSIFKNKIKNFYIFKNPKNSFKVELVNNNLITKDNLGELHIIEGVDPGVFGMTIEALLYVFSDFNNINKKSLLFSKVIDFLNGSVPYSIACMIAGEIKIQDEIKKIIANADINEKVYKKSIWFKKHIGNSIDIQKKLNVNSSVIDYKNDLKIINCFEVDIVTEKGYVYELKCSKKSYESGWFYQLILYYFLLAEIGIETEGIGIYNPMLGELWNVKMSQIIHVKEARQWLLDNEII